MKDQDVFLNNLDELVKFCSIHDRLAEKRFKLYMNTKQEFDDPEAGEVWQDKDRENYHDLWAMTEKNPSELSIKQQKRIREKYPLMNDAEIIAHLDNQGQVIRAAKPSMHTVESWYLRESGDGFHPLYLYVSAELGHQIDSIWKRRPRWRGSKELERANVPLSLLGILNRLGTGKDIKKRIAANREAQRIANIKAAYARRINLMKNHLAIVTHQLEELGFTADQISALTIAELSSMNENQDTKEK